MLKEEFIKLANQGNARVSLNKKIQDFKKVLFRHIKI